MSAFVRIGIDVGGTNTDAALMGGHKVLATIKTPTTTDINQGVLTAITTVLDESGLEKSAIGAVMIGTTQFLNAVIERRQLQKVGVLRLCGRATRSVPPMIDWPDDLREMVDGGVALVGGGVEFDGKPLAPLDVDAIHAQCQKWRKSGVVAIAISSVFALVGPEMELEAAAVVAEELPGASISLSHRIGHSGLLQRENATILNASLTDLGHRVVTAFREAFADLGLTCPLFLTQNDGTVMAADYAERFPIFTLASGPTNSMRGAAFLTGLQDAVVVDIGGTTSDIGLLVSGFPRGLGDGAEIAGIKTNFRVPDVLSIGLGGGSFVRDEGQSVGPDSVGFRLLEQARVFGGEVLTATDIAVAGGLSRLGNPSAVADLDSDLVNTALSGMTRRIEDVIDRMKPSAAPIPAILVGGGSVLISGALEGASDVIKPDHFGSANAIGAAIAQISGEVDTVVSLENCTRKDALEQVVAAARARAVEAGAMEQGLETTELQETALAYLPGNAVRISAKVVGELQL